MEIDYTLVAIVVIVLIIIALWYWQTNGGSAEKYTPSFQVLSPGAGKQIPGIDALGKSALDAVNMPLQTSNFFG